MILDLLVTSLRGFAMGAADIVPGVSGGTIALVLGIYPRLIASIRAGSSSIGRLIGGDLAGFRSWLRTVEWTFLLPLGFGVLVAIVSLAHLIETLLAEQPITMAAVFLGLVAGSVLVAIRLLTKPGPNHVAIIAVVAIVTFAVLGLREGTSEDAVTQALDPRLWAFFASGAVAICAMILPGVSGSFLLVILGMYGPVLTAVNDRNLGALGVFLVGAIIGLALFSQILDRALRTHHDAVLAVLIGLMAGSVRVLWPWPYGVNTTELALPDGNVAGAIVAAAVAFTVVVIVARAAQRLEDPEAAIPVVD